MKPETRAKNDQIGAAALAARYSGKDWDEIGNSLGMIRNRANRAKTLAFNWFHKSFVGPIIPLQSVPIVRWRNKEEKQLEEFRRRFESRFFQNGRPK